MARITSERCYVEANETVYRALELMEKNNVGGVFVVNMYIRKFFFYFYNLVFGTSFSRNIY